MFFNYTIKNYFYRARLFGAKFFSIGNSVLGKKILACHVGNYVGPQILVHGAIHGREYITSLLCFRQIEYALKNLKGIGGIYFVPIVNPDGVDIAINGTKNVCCSEISRQINFCTQNYNLFKANANCVDLNVNFDANWGKGKRNVFVPNFQNYVGVKPFSEQESIALKNFCNKIKPVATISYHCKGEVIYYGFEIGGKREKIAKDFACFASKVMGYKICKSKGSTGGFKDWAVLNGIDKSITIEVGSDKLKHPLGKNNLNKILKENLKLPVLIVENLINCDIMTSCMN